jgi:hypothetical protein
MIEKLMTLLRAIREVPDDPGDVESSLRAAPAAASLPEPQVGWTLIGLLHYRRRKLWAWRVMSERLRAQLDRPEKGMVSFMDVVNGAQKGVVPGLPDWRYSLDGNDSRLTHRGTGEDIHVDALNGPELIWPGYFIEHFEAHREPGPAEERLASLFPRGAGCLYALGVLERSGLLHPGGVADFEMCGRAAEYAPDVERFLSRWRRADGPEDRARVAARIGDWPAAHQAAVASGDDRLVALTAPRARKCHARWLKRLRGRLAQGGMDGDLLLALAEARDDELPRHLADALSGNDASHAALDVIADDRAWRRRVFDLLTRPAPVWDPFTRWKAARYLARHRHRVGDVIDHFLLDERRPWGLLIELALGGGHGKLRAFVREGLRSRDPDDRMTAAAVLALRDDAWSRRVLGSALDESDDPDATLEVREVIRLAGDARAVRDLGRWETAHPERKPASLLDSSRMYYHVMYGGCERRLLERMEELSGKAPVGREGGRHASQD